jgi:hypothetical protein
MEFMSRGVRAVTGQNEGAPQGHPGGGQSKRGRWAGPKWLMFILLISVVLLLAAVSVYVAIGGVSNESTYIKDKQYQAVFLNGGQVYFGKIRNLNNKYLTMDNIYYLRVNQQVQPNQSTSSTSAQDISLAKLGCELHGPDDLMVLNRDQVTFWENLKDDGQVVKAISEYLKANPNGQQCSTTNNQSTTPTPTPTTTPTPTPTPTPSTNKKP